MTFADTTEVASAAGLVSVDGRHYPLESTKISGRAQGGIAATRLTQVYENPYEEPLEVLYTLPLPADAAVTGYTIRLGERLIRGEVRPRREAEKEYKKALIDGRTAAMLSQERADTFTQRLGCLPAGQKAEIEIELLQPLAFLPAGAAEGARWEYRFPTVVGVRYQGAPGRVPDAGRLDVVRAEGAGAIPTRLALDLAILDDALEALAVHSLSHGIVCTNVAGGVGVTLAGETPLDRDLVVSWTAGETGVNARLAEGRGLAGDEGRYGTIVITPPRTAGTTFRRDLTLLIDASGSMSGEPIECAKELAGALVRSLGAEDRFEILTFADKPVRLTNGLLPASRPCIEGALAELARVSAGGATEMLDGITKALESLRPDAQRQVLLLTDGEIGFESEVISGIKTRLPGGARLHVAGIGSAPNRSLTHGAARAGRGVEVFVGGRNEVEAAAERLCKATVCPVLTEVNVGGGSVRGFAPARPRDIFAGQPALIFVELEEAGGTLEVSGHLAGSKEPWRWSIAVPARATTASAPDLLPLGALFGRERVADLELAADRSIDAEVEQVALRHRIVSRLTSLVAFAEEPCVDPLAPRRRERLPVELPAGISAEAVGLCSRVAYLLGAPMPSGTFSYPGASFSKALPAEVDRSERYAYSPLEFGFPDVESPTPVQIELSGQLLKVDGDLLILEVEVPFDGFLLPDGRVTVTIDGGSAIPARLDPAASSPQGPHRQGTLVRMAIRPARRKHWPAGAGMLIVWRSPETRWEREEFQLRVTRRPATR